MFAAVKDGDAILEHGGTRVVSPPRGTADLGVDAVLVASALEADARDPSAVKRQVRPIKPPRVARSRVDQFDHARCAETVIQDLGGCTVAAQ